MVLLDDRAVCCVWFQGERPYMKDRWCQFDGIMVLCHWVSAVVQVSCDSHVVQVSYEANVIQVSCDSHVIQVSYEAHVVQVSCDEL